MTAPDVRVGGSLALACSQRATPLEADIGKRGRGASSSEESESVRYVRRAADATTTRGAGVGTGSGEDVTGPTSADIPKGEGGRGLSTLNERSWEGWNSDRSEDKLEDVEIGVSESSSGAVTVSVETEGSAASTSERSEDASLVEERVLGDRLGRVQTNEPEQWEKRAAT